MANSNRENALCGAGLVLGTQMSGGIITIYEHLVFFSDRIRYYKLNPWDKKGRDYLIGGMNELVSTGGYDSLTTCESCYKNFLMKLDTIVVDLFLKELKGEIYVYDWVKCNKCGGSVEKDAG